MKTGKFTHFLDLAAAEQVPDTLDLAPRILSRVRQETQGRPRPKIRLAAALALVTLAVLLLTTAAYTLYRWVIDPGLQSVQDAGLVTGLDITAQPTLQPTSTPAPESRLATPLNLSQTLAGVTLSLDWVYLDEGRLVLGWHSTDLPAGADLEAPQITFVGLTPQQAQGSSQALRAEGNRAIYISYQVIHADAVGGEVSLALDVPLVQNSADAKSTLGQFHFELERIPVFVGQTLAIQQTYAVRNNGLEVRLESARVSPSGTDVVVCHTFPAEDGKSWQVELASARLDDGAEESLLSQQPLDGVGEGQCARLVFGAGSPGGAARLLLRINQFGLAGDPASQEKLEGPWEFTLDLPSEAMIPGVTLPTPVPPAPILGEETIEGVTMTLDWVFADAKRVAFGYTIRGLPDNPQALALSGNVSVKDGNGLNLGEAGGTSSVEHVANQPGTVSGTWSGLYFETYTESTIRLSIDVTLDGSSGYNYNNIIANFPLAYEVSAFPADYVPSAYPEQRVGTYHFEAETQVYPLQVLEPGLSLVSNGVEMRLEKIEMTPSYAMMFLCYRKPTSADWMIGGRAKLTSGGYEAGISGYTLLGDSDYGMYADFPDPRVVAGETGGRCVSIDFLLGYTSQAKTMTLVIPALEQSIPEVIPDAEIQQAREKLQAQGIEMEYTTVRGAGGGGGGGPVFNKLPEGMDAREAYQLWMSALGYAHPGPWVFEIEVP